VKIVLMGASGFVGSKLLLEALNRGHRVTAVSRTPEKLVQHSHLHPAKADISDIAALTGYFEGQDAVIHSYAPPGDPAVRAFISAAFQAGDQRLETVSAYAPCDRIAHDAHVKRRIDEQTLGTRNIIAATKAAGVKRILAVGGAGTLLWDGTPTMDHPKFPKAYEGGAKSTAVVNQILVTEAQIHWTVLCPALMLAPGKRTGNYRLGLDNLLIMADGSSKISLGDYAMAMVDELEQPRHTGRRFTVGY
jgi:uncharacterized protein